MQQYQHKEEKQTQKSNYKQAQIRSGTSPLAQKEITQDSPLKGSSSDVSNEPIQAKMPNSPIQREENEGSTESDGSFDVDFSVLPPALQLRLYRFGLDADVSEVSLSYGTESHGADLSYEYGGPVSLGYHNRGFNSRLSFNPDSMDMLYSGAYQNFSPQMYENAQSWSIGLSLGYGTPLMPAPHVFNHSMHRGADGMHGIMGGLSDGMNDPMAFYDSQSENIDSVSNAIDMARRVAAHPRGGDSNFGAGLRLSYSPGMGMMIYAGAQLNF